MCELRSWINQYGIAKTSITESANSIELLVSLKAIENVRTHEVKTVAMARHLCNPTTLALTIVHARQNHVRLKGDTKMTMIGL